MADLTNQSNFSILDPPADLVVTTDLVLLPENSGTDALRELSYPADALPPLIYAKNPDRWLNFDTVPLTARPMLKAEMTISDTKLARWSGYQKDRPVVEIWQGSDREAPMSLYFFRRLWEYFANPPDSGYITWNPKDRADLAYNIVIADLYAVDQGGVMLDYQAAYAGYLRGGEVRFTFYIIGEA